MAIVKELKNLGKKMTGADLTGNTVSEALKAIEEKYTGGGGRAETTVLEANLGEGVYDDGLYTYETSLSELPDIPTENVYLRVGDEEYPLALYDAQDEEAVYSAAYNYASDGSGPVESPCFWVCVKERTGEGNDVIPGLLGGADTSAYILYLETDESIDGETVVLVQKEVTQNGGKLVVHLTESEEGGETVYSADHTIEEIIAADAAGQVVECEHDGSRLSLSLLDAFENDIGFSSQEPGPHKITFESVYAYKSDGGDRWSYDEEIFEIPDIPAYDTTEDLGKVLAVTADGLAWVTPT